MPRSCEGGKYTHRRIFRGNALPLSCIADEHVYINERYHRRVIFASGSPVSPLSLVDVAATGGGGGGGERERELSLSIASTIVICAIAIVVVADCYVHITTFCLSVIFLFDSPQTNSDKVNDGTLVPDNLSQYLIFFRNQYFISRLVVLVCPEELIARVRV